MSISLTIKQIAAIAEFSGLVVDYEKTGFSDEDMEQEFVVSQKIQVQGIPEEDIPDYEGMTVHCAEYPEEGFLPLEEEKI